MTTRSKAQIILKQSQLVVKKFVPFDFFYTCNVCKVISMQKKKTKPNLLVIESLQFDLNFSLPLISFFAFFAIFQTDTDIHFLLTLHASAHTYTYKCNSIYAHACV